LDDLAATTFELADLLKLVFPFYAWGILTFYAWRHCTASHDLAAQLAELRQTDQINPTLLNKVGTNLENIAKKRKNDVVLGWFLRLLIFLVISSGFQLIVMTVSRADK
jgi:hypothetical protein